MLFAKKIDHLIKELKKEAKKNKNKTGFFICNTAKNRNAKSFTTPIRTLEKLTTAGAIVYSDKDAEMISRKIDGIIDYIFADCEKKVPDINSRNGKFANTERTIRENIKKSKFMAYKGNDLSVDSVDSFVSFLYKDDLRGLGGKRVVIVGSGNLGSKLALKLVERGADVTITRRNLNKAKLIAKALNTIKPSYTKAKITYSNNDLKLIKGIDILIGSTNGIKAIDENIINKLNSKSIIMDIGKGSFTKKSINKIKKNNLNFYRLDITSSLMGIVASQLFLEKNINKKMGRKTISNINYVSGGLFGFENNIVVDNVFKIDKIFGIADGNGDFKQKYNLKNKYEIKKTEKIIKK